MKKSELLDILETVWGYFHDLKNHDRETKIDRVDMLDEIYYALLKEGRRKA